jgi:hypothetical protein
MQDVQRGRYLVADRVFRQGQAVLEQEPYRAVLLDEQVAGRCDHTFDVSPHI